jgi:signal transduction histidine kinase
MLMFVLLMGAIGGLAYSNLSQVGNKLRFLEAADGLTNAILELRRTEKNYFLYQDPGSFEEARGYLDDAEAALARLSDQPGAQLSPGSVTAVRGRLADYRQALKQLEAGGGPRIAELVRNTGRSLLEAASRMPQEEQRRVEFLIHFSKQAMLISFAGLFVLGLVGAYFIGQRIVRPLAEIERTTKRISSGDFTPVPGPFANDETGSLVLAFNTMVRQLQERTEQLVQARKMAALGTLTAGVAHELNNPLNNIYITAEMLEDDFTELPEDKKLTLIHDVAGQADRAKDIVRNLLTFARERDPRMEPCSLRQVLEDSLRFVVHQAELANIDVECDLPPALLTAQADPQQLQQVFVNLLLNALQAMPAGGKLKVSARAEPGGGCLRVSVADTGEGIAPEVLPRIFDPFFTTKEAGTGLGLAVTYGIVKRHGGNIEARSTQGKGAEFIVSLPITGKGCQGVGL